MASDPGFKADAGKLQYHLVDDRAEEALASVLTFGAVKYTPGGWRMVEGAIDRYYDAFQRHAREFRRYVRTGLDEHRIDQETGLPHTAQMYTNAMFLCALDLAANDPMFDGRAAAAEAVRRWRALEAGTATLERRTEQEARAEVIRRKKKKRVARRRVRG